MTSFLMGYVLLFNPCGTDACEWVPVTEKVYQQIQACEQVSDELKMRRPQYEFRCGEVYRSDNVSM